jgi:hypothetical protein
VWFLLNGGTNAQGFTGAGADSIIGNSPFNLSPRCPDVRMVAADAPTDVNGIAYITLTGADPSSPGVSVPDPNRKWGHYDSLIPVYAAGVKLPGRLTPGDTNGSYILRIKSFDWTGGLDALFNQGEAVTVSDLNGVSNSIGVNNALSYWKDFDYSGSVTVTDYNMVDAHLNHDCDTPNGP